MNNAKAISQTLTTTRKEINKAAPIPTNKMVAVESVYVGTGNKLHLPNAEGKVSGEAVFFKAKYIADDCKIVHPGDFIVPKIDARNMRIHVLDVQYLLINEDDIVMVLR